MVDLFMDSLKGWRSHVEAVRGGHISLAFAPLGKNQSLAVRLGYGGLAWICCKSKTTSPGHLSLGLKVRLYYPEVQGVFFGLYRSDGAQGAEFDGRPESRGVWFDGTNFSLCEALALPPGERCCIERDPSTRTHCIDDKHRLVSINLETEKGVLTGSWSLKLGLQNEDCVEPTAGAQTCKWPALSFRKDTVIQPVLGFYGTPNAQCLFEELLVS